MAYCGDQYSNDRASRWTYAQKLRTPHVIEIRTAPKPAKTPDTRAQPAPTLLQVYSQVGRNENPRAILGLKPTSDERDVTVAFRKLALLLHPDKCVDEKKMVLHQALFIKIDAAKDAILDSKYKATVEDEPEETSTQPTRSAPRNPMPEEKQMPREKPKRGCPPGCCCGGQFNRSRWIDDDPQEAWNSMRSPAEEKEYFAALKLVVRAPNWIAPNGRVMKNAKRDALRLKTPIHPDYDWEAFLAIRKKVREHLAFTEEKKKETKRGVRESKRLNFWLDDDASYVKDEEKELNVEHEYILEEDEIPNFVTFNLGDWIPGL
ncbi:hypothetical protein CB0940_03218 [Cercospora beticola]|uniref:J domain-containing protein n=1 Tax=Cercospora beticola TaxID=122368 RepID=A0A2G5I258_CERBT|nr:hypothetical protein CB0940_03218 [Cercospora beticola]PIA98850.1 hypothetical protein CB0940_03218 [Cercospora beticola]WPB00392.1 hypothetical protein RHO25_005011 [Cercospora beticola]CAK1361400.1 unnamed protein product [Cercospora beticola]